MIDAWSQWAIRSIEPSVRLSEAEIHKEEKPTTQNNNRQAMSDRKARAHNTMHGETCIKVDQIFKANERITRVFEYEAIETGTYILDARYRIIVDNISIQNKIDEIILEVK